MGLDMFLIKMPRCGNATAKEVYAIDAYFRWRDAKNSYPEAKNYTFEEWTGVNTKDLPPKSIRDIYEPLYVTRYHCWDTEKKYGNKSLTQEVGYWRKAYEINNWFIQNVLERDDAPYYEVTKEDLIKLRGLCQAVLCNCKTENDESIVDNEVAEVLLPYDRYSYGTSLAYGACAELYDEYYISTLVNTVEIINEVLSETDFENEMLHYCAS